LYNPVSDDGHCGTLTLTNDALTIEEVIKSRRMRWAGHVARMGVMANANSILVGKSEEKRPLGRSRHRWEDSTRMDCRETGSEGVD